MATAGTLPARSPERTSATQTRAANYPIFHVSGTIDCLPLAPHAGTLLGFKVNVSVG